MIRINLVREGRSAKRGGRAGVPTMAMPAPSEGAPPWGLLATVLLLFVLGTLAYGAYLFMQNHNLAVEIAQQKEELKKYEGARKKVKELEAKKQEYTAKVDQIKKLKDQQSIPVQLMNRLVEVLPEGAWYVSVQQKGMDISIEGRAKSIKTISSLYDNLIAAKVFDGVQLGNVQQQRGREEIYSFKLSMAYKSQKEKADKAAGADDQTALLMRPVLSPAWASE